MVARHAVTKVRQLALDFQSGRPRSHGSQIHPISYRARQRIVVVMLLMISGLEVNPGPDGHLLNRLYDEGNFCRGMKIYTLFH